MMDDFWRLFLDDERDPAAWFSRLRVPGNAIPEEARDDYWVICRSAEEAKNTILARGMPVYISFDHDLGEGESGHDFAKWLIDRELDGTIRFPDGFAFGVHSQNPVGAENIRGLMNNYLVFREENVKR